MLDSYAFQFETDSSVAGKEAKAAAFPVYPDHNASKLDRQAWFQKFRSDLIAAGFGCLLRKETPREAIKLVDRAMLPVPADPAAKAAVDIKNDEIKHMNTINAIERLAIENEYCTRMASKLSDALTPNALALLESLQTAYPCKDAAGAIIPDAYHGQNMWFKLVTQLDEAELEAKVQAHEKVCEGIRDHVLPDNVDLQTFSDVVVLLDKHNALQESPWAGEKYGKVVLGFMPDALGTDVRQIKARLKDADHLKDKSKVIQACKDLIAATHKPSVAPTSMHAVKGFTSKNWLDDLKDSIAKTAKDSVNAAMQSHASKFRGGGNGGGGNGNGGGNPQGGPRKTSRGRLADGKRCSSGTCVFNHDEVKPGAVCFRDPRVEVTLPAKLWADTKHVANIAKDRDAEAKRLHITAKALRGPDGTSYTAATATPAPAVPASAAASHASLLEQIVGSSGYMTSALDDDYDGGYSLVDEPFTSPLGRPVDDDGAGVGIRSDDAADALLTSPSAPTVAPSTSAPAPAPSAPAPVLAPTTGDPPAPLVAPVAVPPMSLSLWMGRMATASLLTAMLLMTVLSASR